MSFNQVSESQSMDAGAEPARALAETISDQVYLLTENGLAGAVLIIVSAIIFGKIVDKLLRATMNVWVKKSDTPLDDLALEHLSGPIVQSTVLYGFWVAANHLQIEEEGARLFVMRVIQTLLVMIWSLATLRLIDEFLRHASKKRDRYRIVENRTFPLFSNLSKLVLVGVAIYGVILVWDVNTQAWLASAGIAGLAISFAAKDTLSNLFAGVFIIADAPYRIGDYIVLQGIGTRGEVTSIGLRSTRVVTRDDIEITIPNAVIGGAQIVNQTAGPSPKMRIRVPVGVAYDTDAEHLRGLLMEVAAADPIVCETPEPRVRFRAFGASSLDFELLVWVEDPEDRGKAVDSLLDAVLTRLRTEKIEIPYPKRDLYLKEQPSA